MPDITYKFHPVYDVRGKEIPVEPPSDLPPTKGKMIRMGYPFHILKKRGDEFVVQDMDLASSLRTQASKRNAQNQTWKIQVTNCDAGLLVKRVKR